MAHKDPEVRRAYMKAWTKKNLAYFRAYNKAWREKNPDKHKAQGRRRVLRRYYGMTVADYEELFRQQGRRCALCGTESCKRWTVDHCHVTKFVRGIVCEGCNLSLGHYERLLIAAPHLEEYRCRRVKQIPEGADQQPITRVAFSKHVRKLRAIA